MTEYSISISGPGTLRAPALAVEHAMCTEFTHEVILIIRPGAWETQEEWASQLGWQCLTCLREQMGIE